MLRTLLLAGLTIALSLPTARPASSDSAPAADIHPYAPVKRPRLPITGRDTSHFIFRGPYPARGVMLVHGNVLSAGTGWTIVDVDARTMTTVEMVTQTFPDGEREAVITGKHAFALKATELNDIIDGANRVWDPPLRPDPLPPIVADATCDPVLFDGNDIVHDWGFMCQSVQLVERIDAIGREKH